MKASAEGNPRKKAPATRATPEQTIILKKAYAHSPTASQEQLKILSEETGLSEKWIHQWFGRQRLKKRKEVAKNGDTASSDIALSPQEIMNVKMEQVDASSPLLPDSSSPDSSFQASVSADSISTSSSVALESSSLSRSAASGNRSKAKGKAPAKAPPKNTKTRKTGNTKVKTEAREPPAVMRYNPVPAAPPPTSAPPRGLAHNNLLPRIAPPKRSPVTTAIAEPPATSRSRLSEVTTQHYMMYVPPGDALVPPPENFYYQPTFSRSKSQRNAVYQQGPVFRNGWNNQGPSAYTPRSSGSDSGAHAHYETTFAPPGISAAPSQSLTVSAPAFDSLGAASDWEQYAAPAPHFLSHYHAGLQHATPSFVNQPYKDPCEGQVYMGDGSTFQQEVIDLRHQSHGGVAMSASSSTTTQDPLEDALNPDLAPLKHLTDVLADFKADDGSYVALMAQEWRDNLLACLLNENLNPFQAAMGLSLLSKLGFLSGQ
ncbi:hypothetical protein NLJ89_g5492 [Agrocybe chaxingu]|uniref:Homeobox domain-containing protein n=1 Tax=Agrocybe chaxingu TaxID=84603 RepID=A0A9W8K768_9AGAR|nr:hypothetical protein NLJ89_g5492 [Agrocybe chaxingu]